MITDNLYNKSIEELSLKYQPWEMLKTISHRSVEELHKESPNLLIFPHCLGDICGDFSKKHICEIVGNTITTGNIVGFIGINDKSSGKSLELTIHSRFHKSEDGEDYFLHYMLQKVFKKLFNITILDLKHGATKEDIFDFAIYLFPHYLKRAIKQGLFRQYCNRDYNDANVRGAIDVSRHIRTNTPFRGRIAYRTREYQYDNPLMQLIRHTIEYIRNHEYAGNILKCDKDMSDAVRTIYNITPTYNANDRERVIAHNIKPITHPFYTEYRILQQLCLHILRRKGVKYNKSNDKIYGMLFDCSWLWEEYLSTIMPEGFTHAVRAEKNGYKFFDSDNSHQRYPDFYSKVNQTVLDAKYKRIDINGIQRNDLFQLIAYMHTLPADYGALIYPLSSSENSRIWQEPKKLNGHEGWIDTIGIEIPQDAKSYQDFFDRMERYRLKWDNNRIEVI